MGYYTLKDNHVCWDDNYVSLGYVDFEIPLRQTKVDVESAVEYIDLQLRDQIWAADT